MTGWPAKSRTAIGYVFAQKCSLTVPIWSKRCFRIAMSQERISQMSSGTNEPMENA
jgi:hypothetical protein